MKLTPLDIRKHDFSTKLRGYDPDEVKGFMETISYQWEEVLDELRRAEDRVREIENKISHYEKVEMALQEALETARSGAKRSQENADERAQLIVDEAELRAEQIVQDAEQNRFRLQQDVVTLTNRHNEVTARLRHFLMSELEILARHEEDQPIGFMKLVPASPAESLPPAPDAPPETPADTPRSANARSAPPKRVPAPQAAQAEMPASSPTPEPAPPSPRATDAQQDRTTYADLYARAAEAERDRPAPPAPEPAEEPASEETTWTLRSIVTGLDEEDEAETASPTEKERIRRILEDLD